MTPELLSVLDSVGPSAQFCTDGNRPPVLPGLVVKGLGEIGVPVSAADARRLIAKAAQAPYGRGEETIVDTAVRRVWQLEPRQLAFSNPAWEPFFASLVEAVREELGIAHEVRHELYKLLVYETGSFFAPHRDTEKQEGMFATLVCTKTRASFERRLAKFEADTNHLRELEHGLRLSPHPPREERNRGRSRQKDEGKGSHPF